MRHNYSSFSSCCLYITNVFFRSTCAKTETAKLLEKEYIGIDLYKSYYVGIVRVYKKEDDEAKLQSKLASSYLRGINMFKIIPGLVHTLTALVMRLA